MTWYICITETKTCHLFMIPSCMDINVFKPRKYLAKECYAVGKVESIFLEVMNEGKKNSFIGCIPQVDIDEFNTDFFFGAIMEKLINENKEFFILGVFNIDLMKLKKIIILMT